VSSVGRRKPWNFKGGTGVDPGSTSPGPLLREEERAFSFLRIRILIVQATSLDERSTLVLNSLPTVSNRGLSVRMTRPPGWGRAIVRLFRLSPLGRSGTLSADVAFSDALRRTAASMAAFRFWAPSNLLNIQDS